MSTPNTFIAPTIGRVVWFYPSKNSAEAGFAGHGGPAAEPYTALIVHVWSDRMVNLCVFDATGTPHSRTSVELVQDDATCPGGGHYCTWMPYQKGQAKAQIETKVYADGTVASGTAPLPDISPAEQDAKKTAAGEAYLAFAHEKGILPFDFGVALKYLKHGRRVARAGWNGKGMFVYMVPAASYPAQTGAAKAHFGEGSMVPYNAYFALKGVDGAISTWVPSITDALAEDWVLLPA